MRRRRAPRQGPHARASPRASSRPSCALAVGLSLATAVEFRFQLGLAALTAAATWDLARNGPDLVGAYEWLTPLLGATPAFVAAVVSLWPMTTPYTDTRCGPSALIGSPPPLSCSPARADHGHLTMDKITPLTTHHGDLSAETCADVARARRARGRVILVAVAVAAVTIDAASKVWASSSLRGNSRSLGPLTLRLVHNRGVAFGVGAYLPAAALIAITAAIAVVIAVAGWRARLHPPLAAGLIVGGALANVADRLAAGSVVDFIDIGRWPVFNLADVILLTGIGLLLLAKRSQPPAGAPSADHERTSKIPSPDRTVASQDCVHPGTRSTGE